MLSFHINQATLSFVLQYLFVHLTNEYSFECHKYLLCVQVLVGKLRSK